MILSDAEIRAIQARHPTDNDPMDFAHALIAAAHAAGRKSVHDACVDIWKEEVIAAARVAALEEAAKVCESDALGLEQGDDCATGVYRVEKAIRALVGAKT